jgi:DNA-binding NtrC family response regulator
MAYILAIDDEPEWLELYAERLVEMGHSLRAYTNGQVALNEMGEERPDLVILDLRMAPSGRQMLWMIRRYWPDVPVILSSAYAGYKGDPDYAGVDAFLEKSTDLTRLVGAIEYVLSKKEPGRPRPTA